MLTKAQTALLRNPANGMHHKLFGRRALPGLAGVPDNAPLKFFAELGCTAPKRKRKGKGKIIIKEAEKMEIWEK